MFTRWVFLGGSWSNVTIIVFRVGSATNYSWWCSVFLFGGVWQWEHLGSIFFGMFGILGGCVAMATKWEWPETAGFWAVFKTHQNRGVACTLHPHGKGMMGAGSCCIWNWGRRKVAPKEDSEMPVVWMCWWCNQCLGTRSVQKHLRSSSPVPNPHSMVTTCWAWTKRSTWTTAGKTWLLWSTRSLLRNTAAPIQSRLAPDHTLHDV